MRKFYCLISLAFIALLLSSCGRSGSSSNINLPEQKVVKVSTAQELIDAISNDTKIIVDTKEILDFDDAIMIDNISNFTLEGAYPETHLRITESVFDVIDVFNSDHITICNLKLGHNVPRGSCEGGVITVLGSHDIDIRDCKLYGCGREGLFVNVVSNLKAENLEIYECSAEGVDIRAYKETSDNIVINNCNIHDCGQPVSVFASDGDTVTNVVFNKCNISGYVPNPHGQVFANTPVTFNDCVIKTAEPFDADTKANAKFNNCKISRIEPKNEIEYKEGYQADPDMVYYEGEEFFGPELEQETLELYSAFPSLDESQLKVVKVTDESQLGEALKSNTKIIIESDKPMQLFNYEYGGDSQFKILGLDNVVIEGAGKGVELFIKNEFDDVIFVKDCHNIVFRNLTLGHDVPKGECDGDVLHITNCSEVVIEKCNLYGSGVVGVHAVDTENLFVCETDIYDCSYGTVSLSDVSNVLFRNCILRDSPYGVCDYSSETQRRVVFERCDFRNIDNDLFTIDNWGVTSWYCKGLSSDVNYYNVSVFTEGE